MLSKSDDLFPYLKKVKAISELRGITCHMGSHSVTCHPTQVNAPRLNPSQSVILDVPNLPTLRDGRLSWLVTQQDDLPGCRQSRIQIVTGPGIEQLY